MGHGAAYGAAPGRIWGRVGLAWSPLGLAWSSIEIKVRCPQLARHLMINATAAAWQCPAGLTAGPWSRFSGCIIGIDLARFLGWWNLIGLTTAAGMSGIFVAAKLHLHDSASSPARVQGFIALAISWLLTVPCVGYAATDPHTPGSSDLALSFSCAGICSLSRWSMEVPMHPPAGRCLSDGVLLGAGQEQEVDSQDESALKSCIMDPQCWCMYCNNRLSFCT